MKFLSDVKLNEDFEITHIDSNLKNLCLSHGLFEGSQGKVIEKLPLKGGIVLNLRESCLGLRYQNAAKIQVK